MKNLLLVLMTLAVLSLVSCNEKEPILKSNTASFELNKKTFQSLADNEVYPLNKLPKTAIDLFKNRLVEDAQGNILGGDFSGLDQYLTPSEMSSFWNVITGTQSLPNAKIAEVVPDGICIYRTPGGCEWTTEQVFCYCDPV